MWARHFEVAIACWLAMSPFVFPGALAERRVWLTDLLLALAICCFALASYWRRLRYAYLGNLVIGLGLFVAGWWAARGGEPPPTTQNHILVGLLLAMFGIIPGRASQPPLAWQRHYARPGGAA